MRFNQRRSTYTGIPREELESMLKAYQNAKRDLVAGGKPVTATYAQGDGNKSVTFTAASLPNLTHEILEIMACLGIVNHARRPIRFGYR